MPGTAPNSSRVKAATCSPTSATRRGSLEPLAREDRAILRLESATVAGHTLKIVILDPPDGQRRPDVEALRVRVAERIGRAPCLRRRLYTPTGRRAAFWLDDRAFSVREHVRALSLGGPVSQDDLGRVCARMMEERLARSRPLWTMDVLDPLEEGSVVVVWRLHHSVADGATAMRLADQVLWDAPAGSKRGGGGSVSPSAVGGLREALIARRPGRLPGTLRRELHRTGYPSPLDGVIGASRAVAFVSVPLGALKRAAKALVPAATVNDAVLMLVTGGLRHWLQARGCSSGDLRVQVPVSLRQRAERADAANRDSFFCVALPLAQPDPVERLRHITAQTARCKRSGDAVVIDTLLRDVGRVAPGLRHALERLTLHPEAFALNVSNVVGPAERPSVLGAPVRALYSIADIGERHALRVAVVSMADELHFGLCADPAIVGDLDPLVVGIRAEACALDRP